MCRPFPTLQASGGADEAHARTSESAGPDAILDEPPARFVKPAKVAPKRQTCESPVNLIASETTAAPQKPPHVNFEVTQDLKDQPKIKLDMTDVGLYDRREQLRRYRRRPTSAEIGAKGGKRSSFVNFFT